MRQRLSMLVVGLACAALATGCTAPKKNCPGNCAGCTNKCPNAKSAGKHFGEAFKHAQKKPTPATDILADPDKYADKFVRIGGMVDWVCQKSGSALGLAGRDIDETLFVRLMIPSEGRVLPLDVVNKNAIIEGTLIVDVMSEAEYKAKLKEKGRSEVRIAAVKGPQKLLRFEAKAIWVEGI